MTNKQPARPDYQKPPVSEVVLSLQFEKLDSLGSTQIGLMWEKFRKRFPKTEEHHPLEPSFEKFGVPVLIKQGVRIEHFDAPVVPRFWFLNDGGTQLIQIQQDRFIYNWRKMDGEAEYPRYETISQTFRKDLFSFSDFLHKEKIGELIPDQCEVTYVNHIVAGNGWDNHGELDKLLTIIKSEYSDEFLPTPENMRLALKYVIPNPDNKDDDPIGRLHISCNPLFQRSDDKPLFSLTLTARGRPINSNIEGALRFMDIGREWIVRGFTSITTPQFHKIWERQK